MRADRLLSILMLLQTRGRMTAHDLAEQLEVSERTIYRDLDALGMAGIPVYTERGPGGGYSLVDGYQTRLTGLTSAEIRALFLPTAPGPLTDLGMQRALEDALLKLSASLPIEARSHIEQTRQRFHIDPSSTSHDGNSTFLLSLVQDAIWNDHRIYLIYQQDNGQHTRCLADPYGLVAKTGEWYLVGAYAGNICTFSIARILLIEATDQVFERPTDFNLAAYWTDYQAHYERREQCEKQTHPRMTFLPHQHRPQQHRRVIRTRKEKKALRPQVRFVRSLSKKTNYVSQKKRKWPLSSKKQAYSTKQSKQGHLQKKLYKKKRVLSFFLFCLVFHNKRSSTNAAPG